MTEGLLESSLLLSVGYIEGGCFLGQISLLQLSEEDRCLCLSAIHHVSPACFLSFFLSRLDDAKSWSVFVCLFCIFLFEDSRSFLVYVQLEKIFALVNQPVPSDKTWSPPPEAFAGQMVRRNSESMMAGEPSERNDGQTDGSKKEKAGTLNGSEDPEEKTRTDEKRVSHGDEKGQEEEEEQPQLLDSLGAARTL